MYNASSTPPKGSTAAAPLRARVSNKLYDFAGSGAAFKVVLFGMLAFTGTLLLVTYGTDMRAMVAGRIAFKRVDTDGSTTTDALEVLPLDSTAAYALPPLPTDRITPETDVFYNKYPVMAIWSLILSIMCGFAMACIPVFGYYHKWLRDRSMRADVSALDNILVGLVLGIVMFAVPLVMPGIWSVSDVVQHWVPLFSGPFVLWIPLLLTISSAVLGIIVMLSIASASLELVEKASQTPEPPTAMARYKRLEEILRSCLAMLSAMVVLSVITSGTLRLGMMSMFRIPGIDFFPERFVHAYGLFFSVILAAVYLPIRLKLAAAGRSLVKLNVGGPAAQAADAPVSPSESILNELKLLFSILAPFLSSFLPDMFKVLGGE